MARSVWCIFWGPLSNTCPRLPSPSPHSVCSDAHQHPQRPQALREAGARRRTQAQPAHAHALAPFPSHQALGSGRSRCHRCTQPISSERSAGLGCCLTVEGGAFRKMWSLHASLPLSVALYYFCVKETVFYLSVNMGWRCWAGVRDLSDFVLHGMLCWPGSIIFDTTQSSYCALKHWAKCFCFFCLE